jgi:hypothetical protein
MRLSRFALYFGSPSLILISSRAVSAQELPATVRRGELPPQCLAERLLLQMAAQK